MSSFFGPWEFQNVFCIAVSGVGPFGGPLRGPRIGSADKNPLWWVRHAAKFSISFRSRNMCRERESGCTGIGVAGVWKGFRFRFVYWNPLDRIDVAGPFCRLNPPTQGMHRVMCGGMCRVRAGHVWGMCGVPRIFHAVNCSPM